MSTCNKYTPLLFMSESCEETMIINFDNNFDYYFNPAVVTSVTPNFSGLQIIGGYH